MQNITIVRIITLHINILMVLWIYIVLNRI